MYLLPRIVALGKATEMVLTGAVIDADEALRVGVVSRVIEDDALLGETLALARALAAGPIRALALAKHALNDGLTADFARALDTALAAQLACFRTRDFSEGVRAQADKRVPRFIGH